jgi:hypothetical protein
MAPAPWTPAPWTTSVPGSFAHRTLAVRVPAILDDTVAGLRASPAWSSAWSDATAHACAALREELVHGALRGLIEDAPDRAGPFGWDAACAPHVGKSWLDLPWYFAESFFYRRLLEATGHFQPGPAHGLDPFLPAKLHEEAGVPARVAAWRAATGAPDLAALLRASLWGNRADLSYAVGRAHGEQGEAADLLSDDTSATVKVIRSSSSIAILLDNAGTELAFDLLLADKLVSMGMKVTLWGKSHPFFVSDATPADVARTLPLVGLAAGAFTVQTHPFLTSSGFLRTDAMPPDLAAALAAFDLVVVKGDANYRRLVCDAPWPHATPLADAVQFPAPLLALRTCKAEVALGVTTPPRAPDWMTSGRYGVIQLVARG